MYLIEAAGLIINLVLNYENESELSFQQVMILQT